MKTAQRINHDSLWVKVWANASEWAKVTINRAGAFVECTPGAKELAKELTDVYTKERAVPKATNRNIIMNIEKHFSTK